MKTPQSQSIPPAAGEAAHSPLPFAYDDDGMIYSASGFIVSDPHSSPEIDMDEREANAALIVRACNSFGPLVSASIRLLVGITKQSRPDCEWYEGIEDDAREELAAALKAATE